ncbi:MAG: cyclic 2,3-diphosphoglycerate synthase [Candidatus Aenigmatarchaeota archaeon]
MARKKVKKRAVAKKGAKDDKRKKVIIMGAAGRDFHNFNMFFRSNKKYNVVAFTAAQIHGIAGKRYPPELSGRLYPQGIPIYSEERLVDLIRKEKVDKVVLAYSDLKYDEVGHKLSAALAAGADFMLLGPKSTMLKSKKPVIAVCAVRTGSGKSPVVRNIVDIVKSVNVNTRAVVVRHPMPYGRLAKQAVQRFVRIEDLDRHGCTIEEREEYEPHIERGTIVYAGIDYEKILKHAEKEADIIIWDGGNNDLPFFYPDLHITVADARRAGDEVGSYPGEANLRMADVVVISKVATANPKDVEKVIENTQLLNPKAAIIKAALVVKTSKPEMLRGKRVIVVEDGPTLTHGGLSTGAGTIAANSFGAYTVNPRQFAVGSIKDVYNEFPHLGAVLPAMGYSAKQISELEQTINNTPADVVVIGTPVNLEKFLKLNKPAVRVTYKIQSLSKPNLHDVVAGFLRGRK